ncbi:MAG: hypothetical protein KAH93_02440 [Candidatus Aenigmarchaeota archaeon]|nr:hypothetical protein [Candidatus Aenigmarchaeota archaeon]
MIPKECKITCDGKEVATIECKEDGINIRCTKEGKNLCKEFDKGCC